jgi:hypothetical protein
MRQLLGVVLGFGLLAAAAGVRAGDAAETKQVIDKAIKAIGAAVKVDKLRAVTWKGTAKIEAGGAQIAINHEGSSDGPDKFRLELQVEVGGQNQNIMAVINGDKGWASEGGKVKEASAKEIGPVRDALYALRLIQLLPALKDKSFKLSHLGEVKVAERPAVGLSVSRKGRPDVSLFFDKDNGLPVKVAFRLSIRAGQEKELECLFSDYKDFDGLKHCTKLTFIVDGQEHVVELSEVRAVGELEPALFAKPE